MRRYVPGVEMRAHPAWFDTRALEIARKFTLDEDAQFRAKLQVEIIDAMRAVSEAATERAIVLTAELQRERARVKGLTQSLVNIHGLLGPAPVTTIDGKTYVCRLPEQLASEALVALSEHIRNIPEDIAKAQA